MYTILRIIHNVLKKAYFGCSYHLFLYKNLFNVLGMPFKAFLFSIPHQKASVLETFFRVKFLCFVLVPLNNHFPAKSGDWFILTHSGTIGLPIIVNWKLYIHTKLTITTLQSGVQPSFLQESKILEKVCNETEQKERVRITYSFKR